MTKYQKRLIEDFKALKPFKKGVLVSRKLKNG